MPGKKKHELLDTLRSHHIFGPTFEEYENKIKELTDRVNYLANKVGKLDYQLTVTRGDLKATLDTIEANALKIGNERQKAEMVSPGVFVCKTRPTAVDMVTPGITICDNKTMLDKFFNSPPFTKPPNDEEGE